MWIWTLAVIISIYSTLGLTGALAGMLREKGLVEASFVFGFFLVLVTIAVVGFRARPGGAEIGVAIGILAAYLMVFVRMSIPEERTHLIEYGVVGVFFYLALKERAKGDPLVRAPAALAIAATTIVGVLDEGIQAVLPSRVFDPRDILFNFLAGLMSVIACVSLLWARNRVGRR